MMPLRTIALAFAFACVSGAAAAQDPAKPPSMAGRVITKKQIADCKKQAREQKLRLGKRQKFLRACLDRQQSGDAQPRQI